MISISPSKICENDHRVGFECMNQSFSNRNNIRILFSALEIRLNMRMANLKHDSSIFHFLSHWPNMAHFSGDSPSKNRGVELWKMLRWEAGIGGFFFLQEYMETFWGLAEHFRRGSQDEVMEKCLLESIEIGE